MVKFKVKIIKRLIIWNGGSTTLLRCSLCTPTYGAGTVYVCTCLFARLMAYIYYLGPKLQMVPCFTLRALNSKWRYTSVRALPACSSISSRMSPCTSSSAQKREEEDDELASIMDYGGSEVHERTRAPTSCMRTNYGMDDDDDQAARGLTRHATADSRVCARADD